MPISTITTNDTIGIHVTRTSQLITAFNTLESAGAINASITAQTAFGVANSAFANGNANFIILQTVSGVANDAYIQANTARDTANLAFANANTTHTLTVAAFTQANTARDAANTATAAAAPGFNAANAAFDQANTATTIGSGAFGQANIATTIGSGAFGQANTATTISSDAFNQANTARTQANAAFNHANAAFSRANTSSQIRIFSANTTFTVPEGITEVMAVIIGGGGGGYRDNTQFYSGGNGGVALARVAVVPGNSMSIIVGAGGIISTSVYNAAGTGGTSTFGGISVSGGTGATYQFNGSNGSVSGTSTELINLTSRRRDGMMASLLIPCFASSASSLMYEARNSGSSPLVWSHSQQWNPGAKGASTSAAGVAGVGGIVAIIWGDYTPLSTG